MNCIEVKVYNFIYPRAFPYPYVCSKKKKKHTKMHWFTLQRNECKSFIILHNHSFLIMLYFCLLTWKTWWSFLRFHWRQGQGTQQQHCLWPLRWGWWCAPVQQDSLLLSHFFLIFQNEKVCIYACLLSVGLSAFLVFVCLV